MQITETCTNISKSLNLCKDCTRTCHLALLALPQLWSPTKTRNNSTHRSSPIPAKPIQTSKLEQISELLFNYFKQHTSTFKGVKLQERFYKTIFLECTRGVLALSSGSGTTDILPCTVYTF